MQQTNAIPLTIAAPTDVLPIHKLNIQSLQELKASIQSWDGIAITDDGDDDNYEDVSDDDGENGFMDQDDEFAGELKELENKLENLINIAQAMQQDKFQIDKHDELQHYVMDQVEDVIGKMFDLTERIEQVDTSTQVLGFAPTDILDNPEVSQMAMLLGIKLTAKPKQAKIAKPSKYASKKSRFLVNQLPSYSSDAAAKIAHAVLKETKQVEFEEIQDMTMTDNYLAHVANGNEPTYCINNLTQSKTFGRMIHEPFLHCCANSQYLYINTRSRIFGISVDTSTIKTKFSHVLQGTGPMVATNNEVYALDKKQLSVWTNTSSHPEDDMVYSSKAADYKGTQALLPVNEVYGCWYTDYPVENDIGCIANKGRPANHTIPITMPLYENAHSISLASPSSLLLVYDHVCNFGLFDIARQAITRVAYGHVSSVEQVNAYPSIPNMFISASRDSSSKLWDARTMACTTTLLDELPVKSAVLANINGNVFAFTGGASECIKVWDIRSTSQTCLYELSTGCAAPSMLAFNEPSRCLFASVSYMGNYGFNKEFDERFTITSGGILKYQYH